MNQTTKIWVTLLGAVATGFGLSRLWNRIAAPSAAGIAPGEPPLLPPPPVDENGSHGTISGDAAPTADDVDKAARQKALDEWSARDPLFPALDSAAITKGIAGLMLREAIRSVPNTVRTYNDAATAAVMTTFRGPAPIAIVEAVRAPMKTLLDELYVRTNFGSKVHKGTTTNAIEWADVPNTDDWLAVADVAQKEALRYLDPSRSRPLMSLGETTDTAKAKIKALVETLATSPTIQ